MKKEDLIPGKTVLVGRKGGVIKRLYLGNSGLVHFLSQSGDFTKALSAFFTIEELRKLYTIHNDKPDLRPNDPVVVWDNGSECHRHFMKWVEGGVSCIDGGCSLWIEQRSCITWPNYRIPTPDELEERGLPRDYYTSRGIHAENS
jgi:hypothetical protein